MASASLNTTAYRIFKTLTWLCEAPLSAEELNGKFQADPMICRTLSEDSIWLYINTLRTLGCEITRPMPSNGFRYHLLYHPFGHILGAGDLEILVKAKAVAETKMNYPEVLYLDRFFKKLLTYSSLPDRQALIGEMFSNSRSVDYDSDLETLEQLNEVLQQGRLLFLTYRSPVKGSERFYFLPESLKYQKGVLYLSGSRLGKNNLVMLRVERIEAFEATEEPEIQEQLEKIRREAIRVVIRLHASTVPPGIQALGGRCRAIEGMDPPCTEIVLETRDLFVLKQKLLEQGYPFDVLEPETFRAEVLETLLAMKRLYGAV